MGFAICAGVLLLFFGSEALVRGASSLALRLNIKPLIIGLTVIAFGTSSSELVVGIKAALTSHGDILAGDVIGSNIFNITGILGFCGLFRAIPLNQQIIKFDLPVMFFGYFLFSIFLLTGTISRWVGIIFIFLLIFYTLCLYFFPKRRLFEEKEIQVEIKRPLRKLYLDLFFILGGLAFLICGGELLVAGAISLARFLGIDEAKIALGVVAVGTSLPELTCCLVALRKKKYDILVGSIIGSNIFNLFSVVGIAALITPIQVVNIRFLDLAMMFLAGILVCPFFQKKLHGNNLKIRNFEENPIWPKTDASDCFGKNIPRIKAVFLFFCYIVYIFFTYRIKGVA